MDGFKLNQSQLDQARNYHDIQGLNNLRQAAKSGDEEALKEAAKQFEAIFVQMMLKSMRSAQDVLSDENSPFNSQQVKFYRDMHDQQLAVNMSQSGNLGLAEVIVQQLGQNIDGVTPASVLRQGANLSDINRYSSAQVDAAQQNILGPGGKQSAFASPQEFIQALMPAAQQVAEKIGIDPKALVAQAAVETGWGQHMIHKGDGNNSHNLFGIKADHRWQGDKAQVETLEYEQGVANKQKAHFRAYDSFDHSMQDYADFVTRSPRYAQAIENAAEPEQYFRKLQQAGYATDPQYADKILSVMGSDTFARFLHSESSNNTESF